MNEKEKFFKKLIDEHIFGDSVDAEGWHWFGEHKYKEFGIDHVVILEICDVYGDQYAYAHESYEDFYKSWCTTFSDWLMNSIVDDEFDCWDVSIGDIIKLHKYGYLEDRFVAELMFALKKEVKE